MNKTEITVLSISNSFGVNLQKYASQIAKENGVKLDLYVLYIGGCTLERHWNNVLNDSHEYVLYHNGKDEKYNVSMKEILLLKKWDYILTQQASYLGPDKRSFEPFLDNLYAYVKKEANFNVFGLQETWEYSSKFKKDDGSYFSPEESRIMFNNLEKSYKNIVEEKKFFLLNSGKLIHFANKHFNTEFQCDDGFHLSDYGCYLIGANFIKIIFNIKIKNIFLPEELEEDKLRKYIDFVNNF